MKGEDITFAPHSETCDVGTFRPKTGSTPTASVAAGSPATPPAATATVTPVSAPSPVPAAELKLVITASFPAGANPLIGHVIFLMNDRFDDVMHKVGAPITDGSTPGKALQAFAATCVPPKDCKMTARAMNQYYVGKATIDSTGKATLLARVPPGSYFVFGSGRSTNGLLVWDLPVNLNAGDNAISLTATNAELVQ
jgi:hypothetical protein